MSSPPPLPGAGDAPPHATLGKRRRLTRDPHGRGWRPWNLPGPHIARERPSYEWWQTRLAKVSSLLHRPDNGDLSNSGAGLLRKERRGSLWAQQDEIGPSAHAAGFLHRRSGIFDCIDLRHCVRGIRPFRWRREGMMTKPRERGKCPSLLIHRSKSARCATSTCFWIKPIVNVHASTIAAT